VPGADAAPIVDIVCAAYNGAFYLPTFLDSIRAQTHETWRLWIRDDGSSDDTVAVIRGYAAQDPRIHVVADDRGRLGAAGSFAHLLAVIPWNAAYVMFADQDDLWLAPKIERTLAAMRDSEGKQLVAQPTLVHTDLIVADANLNTIHPSFWTYAGLQVDSATLKRLAVRNVVTGAATMINGALRRLASPIPREAILHDWWCACVAAAFGKIIAVREATILYRQHAANVVGATDWKIDFTRLPHTVMASVSRTSELRRGIEQTAAQAGAFLERYGSRLPESDYRFLTGYSEIPRRWFLRRKVDLLRFRMLPEYGALRRIGILLRG
jgi:glycosyltransferase involved in cell wall biosynthesis